MCGIVGHFSLNPANQETLGDMVKTISHRGPDSEGYFRSDLFSGGMCRLSINGLQTGDQPLFNTNKSVVLFYNGEIYNYPYLKKMLEEKGYVFSTGSDGEVICHLYDEVGENFVEYLEGAYAIALWVEKEKTLFLARDLIGEKPLYYSRFGHNDVVFASEISCFRSFKKIDLTLNYQAIWDLPTFLWVPEPETIYNEIKAFPRGHLAKIKAGGVFELKSFQHKFLPKDLEGASYNDYVEETRKVVTESIKNCLLSDVPIGSFLSSGLDSSIVATIAAQHRPDLSTFSIGFENVKDPYHGYADESAAARLYATILGTNHHEIRVTADTFRNQLATFCAHGGQPFAVSSGLGILSVAKAARDQGIKVLLSGDGADECFGGYSWYAFLKDDRLRNGINRADDSFSFQNVGLGIGERLSQIGLYDAPKRAWSWHYYASENEKASLFNLEAFEKTENSLRFFSRFKNTQDWTAEDYIVQDKNFYLPNEMMKKLDRMTMAYSVEGRVPFVTPKVLAHVSHFKYQHFVKGNTLKAVLREAFSNILPQDVYKRPKHGFNVPIDHWLKGAWSDLVDSSFSTQSALNRYGLITKRSLEKAKEMLSSNEKLHGHTIFSYIMLNMWLETVDCRLM